MMCNRPAGALLLRVALIAIAISAARAAMAEDSSGRKIAHGKSIYDRHCARCHGKNLEGQPDWRTRLPSGRLPAPPHDASGHTWHHADNILLGITKNGLKPYAGDDYENDMPAFAGILRDQEIEAVIAYIKSTWPVRETAHQERVNSNATNDNQP